MLHAPEDPVFYVYEWYNTETSEVVYVGKGCGSRYRDKRPSRRNRYFMRYVKKHPCESRIVKDGLTENEAYDYEEKLIRRYKAENLCILNFDIGGRRGGRCPGPLNGMWGKTHTPEVRKILREVNLNRFNTLNSNSRKCQILDITNDQIYSFDSVIDLTNKYIELHEQEFGKKYTFRTARTYIQRIKNTEKLLDNKYRISVFRKNQDNTVPSS